MQISNGAKTSNGVHSFMLAKNQKIKRESRQNIFFSVVLGLLIFVVVGYLITSNLKINARRAELNLQLGKLQAELNDLEVKKAQLQAQISQASQDEYLEKEARDTFNLKKPGEEVVAVLPAEEGGGGQEERSFWEKVMDKIKFW